MRNRFLIHTVFITALSLCTALFSTAFAAVGPQSIKVTFNGTAAEGWQASSGGSITSVAGGVANVQMAMQYDQNNVCLNKYRADFQYQTSGTYTFDKTKDIVWAIKLTAPLPGTLNAKKFEINYKNSSNVNTWINHTSADGKTGDITPSNTITCNDGGVIYYYNLSERASYQWGLVQDGNVTINNIHFIFADATELTNETARYAVDWVATFTSVADLQEFANWKDEETDLSLPYLEMMFRINDGSSYNNTYSKNGFKDDSFEGNYNKKIFAVEYFLIEDYSLEKVYTLHLTTVGGGTNVMAVWDFPYEVSHGTAASEMSTKATTVIGYAPGAPGEGDEKNTPIATSSCTNSVWSFAIPAHKLTPLATIDGKTLVGLLVTSNQHNADEKGMFASSCHATIAHPSFTYTGSNPVVNLTQHTASATLSDAVTAANAGDVIELRSDVTISGSRLEIIKELTIQGATGAEKIICGVAWNVLMVLANDNTADYTVTFRNVIVDGQNTVRDRQLFDSNGKAKLAFDGVSVINTSYSVVTGDVKSAGSNIILSGVNDFPAGIALNKNKRIDHQGASHTSPIRIVLSGDYEEDYAIVLHCNDASLYEAVDAVGESDWELRVVQSGSNKELQGTKIDRLNLADNEDNASTLTTYNGQRVNVTLNRAIVCNGTDYATFCAPFAISRDALEEQLGTTEVLRYKRTDIVGDEAIIVLDNDVTDLEAGVPYLIKPAEGDNVTSLTFRGVTIDNTPHEVADAHYRFIPLFSPATVADAADEEAHAVTYLGSGNQLYWAAANASIKALRAYFRVADGAASVMAPVRRLSFGRPTGVTTDIEQQSDNVAQTKYLENGRLVIIREGIRYNALGQTVK